MTHHEIDIRIYYEDTDAGGIVYHANHLKYAERARTELLRDSGLDNTALRNKYGMIFVVRHLEADYKKPAHLDDLLTLRTQVKSLGNASITLIQTVYKKEQKLCEMVVALACIDVNTFKPVRFPDEHRNFFTTLKTGSETQ